MKYWIVKLLVVSLLFCGFEGVCQSDVEKEGLKGKVKSIREIPYNVVDKFGEIEKGNVSDEFWYNTLIKYNEDGWRI